MRPTIEDHDPEARARALEALRLRLDPAAIWPENAWPVIARAVGYPSGDAARRAVWRTWNRTDRRAAPWVPHDFERLRANELLAEHAGWPLDRIRARLRELDNLKAPEDRDPPSPPPPPRPRKLSKQALRALLRAQILAELQTVEADAPPPERLLSRLLPAPVLSDGLSDVSDHPDTPPAPPPRQP